MSGYAMSVFAICLVGGICLTLSHGQGKAEGVAIGIIVLWVILSPLEESLSHFDPESWLDSIEIPDSESEAPIGAVIEDAFAEGIAKAVAEKFSLDEENIRVRLYGFDSKELCAERIRVILSGRAAFADYKAVEKYLDEMKIGECEVEIEIG